MLGKRRQTYRAKKASLRTILVEIFVDQNSAKYEIS